MTDDRLRNIAVLSIETVRAEAIDLDAFVDEIDCKHSNRKLALQFIVCIAVLFSDFILCV
jgi:hypothetical protein